MSLKQPECIQYVFLCYHVLSISDIWIIIISDIWMYHKVGYHIYADDTQ